MSRRDRRGVLAQKGLPRVLVLDALLAFLIARSGALIQALSAIVPTWKSRQRQQQQKERQSIVLPAAGGERRRESEFVEDVTKAPSKAVLLELLFLGGQEFGDAITDVNAASQGSLGFSEKESPSYSDDGNSASPSLCSQVVETLRWRREKRQEFWDAAVIEIIKCAATR